MRSIKDHCDVDCVSSQARQIGVDMEDQTPANGAIDSEGGRERKGTLKSRHARALAELMGEREDLRGAHAFADFIDDALRWSA